MHVRHWTLVRQVCMILLLVFLLSFTISLFVMHALQKEHLSVLYAQTADLLSVDASTINDEINQVRNAAYDIVTMNDIQEAASDYLDAVDANLGLSAQNRHLDLISSSIVPVLQNSVIACSNLIDARGTVRVQVSKSFLRLNAEEAQILDEKGREADGATLFSSLESYPDWLFVVKELREKRNLSMRHVATLVICVQWQQLQQMLPVQQSSMFHLTLNETGIGYRFGESSRQFPSGRELDEAFGSAGGYALVSNAGQTFYAVRVPGDIVTMTAVMAYNDMFMPQQLLFLRFVGILTLISLGAFLLSVFLARRTTGELQRMIAHMKHIQGDGQETIPLLSDNRHINRESQDLTEAFNSMAERVNQLVDANYRRELWLTKTQLALLQAQINPHFLYNTLNTIYWEAKESGNQSVASMTEALSHLLREAVDVHETLVSVDRELEILRYFLLIEKKRYGSRLQMHFDVSDNVSDLAIPKFSLQVLLENAIHHGVDQMLTPCEISISLYLSGQVCHCRVENTGPAPESNLMEKLRSGEKKGGGSGVGLINMEQRAKVLLGEASRLELYRDEKKNVTVAHLSFPAKKWQDQTEPGEIMQ